ncbi:hypothetical protein, partial [Streptomyces sp. col6]|uniref:hypothetical protein n=1 Tax=Streptomyces sp. col6 TaxID=2478958 RepID=UPI001CD11634
MSAVPVFVPPPSESCTLTCALVGVAAPASPAADGLGLLGLLRGRGTGALDHRAERRVADRALEDAHAGGAHHVGPSGGGGPEE